MECIICKSNNFDIITTKLRNNIQRNVVCCKNCKLLSLENPIENPIDYKYDYMKNHSPIIDKQLSPKELFDYCISSSALRNKIERIKNLLHKDADVLEIGCSSGYFLHSIKNLVNSITGTELSEGNANFAKDNCDIPIYQEHIEKINFNDKKFDLIFMFQVFEHIPNPIEVLNVVKNHLKKNGVIHIEVPNVNDALLSVFNIDEFSKFYFRLPHTYYYDKSTLTKLLSMAGFEGETSFHQEFSFFNHIYWLQNSSPQQNGEIATKIPFWKNHIADKEKSIILKNWFSKIDQEYKKLLNTNEISETLSFTGKLKN